MPLWTLSQDTVPQAPFFHSSHTTMCPLLFSFLSHLPLFFISSACHATPPTTILRHLLSHSFHPPPHCPHRHHHRSQWAHYQACPTATATFTTSLPCTISPLISPSSFPPPSHYAPALPHCQRHQYPPHCHCFTICTKNPSKASGKLSALTYFIEISGSRCITS